MSWNNESLQKNKQELDLLSEKYHPPKILLSLNIAALILTSIISLFWFLILILVIVSLTTFHVPPVHNDIGFGFANPAIVTESYKAIFIASIVFYVIIFLLLISLFFIVLFSFINSSKENNKLFNKFKWYNLISFFIIIFIFISITLSISIFNILWIFVLIATLIILFTLLIISLKKQKF
ncbi:hypothetical protein BCF59_0335 [Mycoplasmopsis mustelae]|uniref:Uncharacterized protein n=1 Tax=Mycoplasmopsis mustelae TaxID=171289 RepID=A0A4V3FNZ1_9BACT|nr:hypothetical protein [Mycoplasmopsis mustelae]TDV24370.1 hypothetical protein BCF59_0335 [Mycoplasmopsis mustelae]